VTAHRPRPWVFPPPSVDQAWSVRTHSGRPRPGTEPRTAYVLGNRARKGPAAPPGRGRRRRVPPSPPNRNPPPGAVVITAVSARFRSTPGAAGDTITTASRPPLLPSWRRPSARSRRLPSGTAISPPGSPTVTALPPPPKTPSTTSAPPSLSRALSAGPRSSSRPSQRSRRRPGSWNESPAATWTPKPPTSAIAELASPVTEPASPLNQLASSEKMANNQ
jgi:hypothetical protein